MTRIRLRNLRLPLISNEAFLATLVLLAGWQVSSYFMNPLLLPSPFKVGRLVILLLTSPQALSAAATTYRRVLEGLVGGFGSGILIAALMAIHARSASFLATYLTYIQGVPSLCWVVMAIIWFRDLEVRIVFVLVMVTLPGFALQIYDGYRSIPRELKEMLGSLRPSLLDRVRHLIIPSLVPPVLTIWKISLGGGIRVALVAELVGGTEGIGFQLQAAEALINMGLVLAWTAILVFFVLVSEKLLSLLEDHALRWRPDEFAQRREPLEILSKVGEAV